MFEMLKLKVPIISIIIGEGSSGGALAICVGNKVVMLENSVYSILSPEGYSSILWKDSSRYKEVAEKMKLTAEDLYKLKVIDKIIEEPITVNENEFNNITQVIKKYIQEEVLRMKNMDKQEIIEERYQKFRKISGYMEVKKNVIGK